MKKIPLSAFLLAFVCGMGAVVVVVTGLVAYKAMSAYAPEKEYVVDIEQFDSQNRAIGGFSYSAATDLLAIYVTDGERTRALLVPMDKVKVQVRTDNKDNYSVKVAEAPWDGTCRSAVILMPLEDDIDRFNEWIQKGREKSEPPKKKPVRDDVI